MSACKLDYCRYKVVVLDFESDQAKNHQKTFMGSQHAIIYFKKGEIQGV